jgi:ankyrin repeat protein
MLVKRDDLDINRVSAAGNTPVRILPPVQTVVKARKLTPDQPQKLFAAASSLAMLKLLLDTGRINVNHTNSLGNTALAHASGDAAKMLVDAGIDLTTPRIDGWTPLHSAASRGCCQLVSLLIRNVVDVNARTADGFTPLGLAGPWTASILLDSLLVDPNYENSNGLTPLMHQVMHPSRLHNVSTVKGFTLFTPC